MFLSALSPLGFLLDFGHCLPGQTKIILYQPQSPLLAAGGSSTSKPEEVKRLPGGKIKKKVRVLLVFPS